MKKIIYIILTIIAVFSIYIDNNIKKYNYISLRTKIDSNRNYDAYIKEYLIKNNKLYHFNNYFYNKSISGLIKDIQNNRTIRINEEDYYLKKVLRESDIVIINVGMEKIINNYDKYDMNKNYRLVNEICIEIENLVKEIRKYAKGDILLIGFYNPTNYYDSKTDELFYNTDIKLNNIMEKYSSIYIDLYDKIKGNKYKDINKPYLLNSYGERMISDIIEYYLE